MVVFKAGECCGKMPTPAFPASLAQAGVLEEDYMRLVNKVTETEANKIAIGLQLTILSGGICVFLICMFGFELNGEIDAFNALLSWAKYSAEGGHLPLELLELIRFPLVLQPPVTRFEWIRA